MKELFKKKSGNKGFTLAELLVVIAILAILIAIAIPVFSGMVAEANLRVNQANVRTVRSAAVSHILTNLDQPDDSGRNPVWKYNVGLSDSRCWVATAEVNNNGDITDLKVYVMATKQGGATVAVYSNGISTVPLTFGSIVKGDTDTTTFFVLSDDTTSKFATVKPKASDGDRNTYWVQVVITDLDPVDE